MLQHIDQPTINQSVDTVCCYIKQFPALDVTKFTFSTFSDHRTVIRGHRSSSCSHMFCFFTGLCKLSGEPTVSWWSFINYYFIHPYIFNNCLFLVSGLRGSAAVVTGRRQGDKVDKLPLQGPKEKDNRVNLEFPVHITNMYLDSGSPRRSGIEPVALFFEATDHWTTWPPITLF